MLAISDDAGSEDVLNTPLHSAKQSVAGCMTSEAFRGRVTALWALGVTVALCSSDYACTLTRSCIFKISELG